MREELEFLKCDLENIIDGMTICGGILSDEEKDILLLLNRCKSVLDRIKPCKEEGKALSQEPCKTSTDEPMTMVYPTILCDDAISREEVIREIKEWIATESKMAMGERFLLDRIKNIPNIEPKTKNIVNHGTMNITL